MLTCNLGTNKINCIDGSYTRDQLKMWSKKGILLCEACGKPYEYCHGRVIPPYFRHKDKNLCEDKYSEAETEEHIQGKRDLYEWIKKQDGVTDVELEAWLPETKQRPDIKFKHNGVLCVIEYQCSPIATEYYERHELYQAAGIYDIWICGTKKYLQLYHSGNGTKRISAVENRCSFYYDSENQFVYKIDNNIDKKKIREFPYHIMKNQYDYVLGLNNLLRIKDNSLDYDTEYYYPSGRRSNKYPYPLSRRIYISNNSMANCYKLHNIRLKSID